MQSKPASRKTIKRKEAPIILDGWKVISYE